MLDTPAERLKFARKSRMGKDSSAAEAARQMGIKKPTYQAHENGSRGFPRKRAAKYAAFFRTSIDWLYEGKGTFESKRNIDQPPVVGNTEVIGTVRGGMWLDVQEAQAPEQPEFIPFGRNPDYGQARQYAYKVVGNSMNKVAKSGSYVIIAEWGDLGRNPKERDLVVVRRERADTYEISLKRILKGRKTPWDLWPESDDPLHQEPIPLSDGKTKVTVKILGLVIGIYIPPNCLL